MSHLFKLFPVNTLKLKLVSFCFCFIANICLCFKNSHIQTHLSLIPTAHTYNRINSEKHSHMQRLHLCIYENENENRRVTNCVRTSISVHCSWWLGVGWINVKATNRKVTCDELQWWISVYLSSYVSEFVLLGIIMY